MAITGATYSTIAKALKNQYLPVLQKQIEKEVQTYDLFKKESEGVNSQDFYIKMFKAYPQGVGPAARGEALPTPSPAGYEESKVYTKDNYGVVEFDAKIEDEGSGIVDIIDFEMEAMQESFIKELNFQLAYGGPLGGRSTVASVAGQVITVDAPVGRETEFIYPNMYLDSYAGATPHNTAFKVTSVNKATKEITVTGGITSTVDNDVLYRAGSYGLGVMGLNTLIGNTGTIQAIDSAAAGNDWWQSIVVDKSAKWGTSAADFLDSIQDIIDQVELQGPNSKINLIYAWPLFTRQYVSVLEAKRQIVNTLEFKAGRKGIAYVNVDREIPILKDRYLPYYTVFFLDTTKIKIYTQKGIHWEEKGGGILKVLERKDIYTAWLKFYAEMGTVQRNSHGKWTNTGTAVGDYT